MLLPFPDTVLGQLLHSDFPTGQSRSRKSTGVSSKPVSSRRVELGTSLNPFTHSVRVVARGRIYPIWLFGELKKEVSVEHTAHRRTPSSLPFSLFTTVRQALTTPVIPYTWRISRELWHRTSPILPDRTSSLHLPLPRPAQDIWEAKCKKSQMGRDRPIGFFLLWRWIGEWTWNRESEADAKVKECESKPWVREMLELWARRPARR